MAARTIQKLTLLVLSLLLVAVGWLCWEQPWRTPGAVSIQYLPNFDKEAPFTLSGVLWVGYDSGQESWRFLKINHAEVPGDRERGLEDPGDPSTWNSDWGTLGYFDGDLSALPSGTHLNNRYDPSTLAFKYKVDDWMIKVGNFWVDQFESQIIDLSKFPEGVEVVDDPPEGGPESPLEGQAPGNGYTVHPNWLAVSQRGRGTSGVSWFVASQAAANNGKRLASNAQWQMAAAGTRRSDATGMLSGGEDWQTIELQDVSRYGVIGCAGSLWEWTSDWGQYGQHYDGSPENWYDWPGPGSYSEWDDSLDGYGDDYLINIAGRAFTRHGEPRYQKGMVSALVRGGSWGDHHRAGAFALIADGAPSYFGYEVGFRCVK